MACRTLTESDKNQTHQVNPESQVTRLRFVLVSNQLIHCV